MRLDQDDSGRDDTVTRGACSHDCPDTCAWLVTTRGGKAISLRGDPDHPFTRGGLCAKVNHFIEHVYDPGRILHPMRRIGAKGEGRFERVSWDAALSEIAGRLGAIITRSGGEAILPYTYAGTQGFVQFASIDRRFFSRIGATRLERNLCGDTANAGLAATQGNGHGIDPEDIRHSRLILLWGTNTIVTNLHLWPIVREAQEAGATVVVIDPVRTRTAQDADWHVRPRPGTDAALALGMMHVIVRDGLHDRDYIDRYTLGFPALADRLGEYPPERVAAITGVAAADVERLGRMYGTTRPAVIRPMVGMEHHVNGAMMFRTIACLPALVGAWRDRGGGLTRSVYCYPLEALNMDSVLRPDLVPPTRSVNMAHLGRVLTELSGPRVEALVVHSCNPATIAPNQSKVLEGLRREDLFTVVHEQFMTDTARYADYLLPATTELEHMDLVPSWGHLYVALNRPAIAPLGEAIPNTELFRRLSRAMGLTEGYLQDSDEQLVRSLLSGGHPWLDGITFERLMGEGWARLGLPEDFRPFSEGGFPTPSGKLEFFSEALAAAGHDPLPTFTEVHRGAKNAGGGEDYPLQLMTSRALHFLNSQYVNQSRHRKAEREPLLDINQDDAASRGICDREMVRVCNDRGTVRVRARVSDRVRPGLVVMPYSWWGSIAADGGNANSLTNDTLSDWGGGCGFHDTFVDVCAEPIT